VVFANTTPTVLLLLLLLHPQPPSLRLPRAADVDSFAGSFFFSSLLVVLFYRRVVVDVLLKVTIFFLLKVFKVTPQLIHFVVLFAGEIRANT
jgi:hypothetical protein